MPGRFSNLHGGFFDSGDWEKRRSLLHHDDFHHRFYHFIASSADALAECLMTRAAPLPPSIQKAVTAWPGISGDIKQLFDRAPAEAGTDAETMLARLALNEIERPGFPEECAAEVRLKAGAVIALHQARNRTVVDQALKDSRVLLAQLDGAVAALSGPRQALGKWEAMAEAQGFLDICSRFDRALSAIPARLRSGFDAA